MFELAGSLLALAEILNDPDQFAEFEHRHVPPRPTSPQLDDGRAEMRELFEELNQMELRHAEQSVLNG